MHTFNPTFDRLARLDIMLARGEVQVADQRRHVMRAAAYGRELELASRVLATMEDLLEQQRRLRDTAAETARRLRGW